MVNGGQNPLRWSIQCSIDRVICRDFLLTQIYISFSVSNIHADALHDQIPPKMGEIEAQISKRKQMIVDWIDCTRNYIIHHKMKSISRTNPLYRNGTHIHRSWEWVYLLSRHRRDREKREEHHSRRHGTEWRVESSNGSYINGWKNEWSEMMPWIE